MNKIIAAIMVCAALLGSVALAQEDITARTEEDTLVFEKQEWMSDDVIVSYYDDNSMLRYSDMYKSSDGEFRIKEPESVDYAKIRASFAGSDDFYEIIADASATATPEPSSAPEPTPSASSTPVPEKTPEATQKPSASFPAVYPKEADALNAYAVADNISRTVIDDEDYYTVTAYYQGEKIKFNIAKSSVIEASSDRFSNLIGSDASVLKKGDVFHFTTNLQGQVKSIEFIFRPENINYILEDEDYGTNFEKLFSSGGVVAGRSGWNVAKYGGKNSSKYQYAFGVITDKTSASVTLCNKSGETENAVIADVESGTIVYTCDMSSKQELETGRGSSAIAKSAIPRAAYDENGKITYSGDYTYNYAFVRMIDGVATDIVVFENY